MSVVRNEVLRELADPSLRVYLVWEHALDGDDERAMRRAAPLARDSRVTEYWDAPSALGFALGDALALPPNVAESPSGHGLAWDVYLVYDTQAAWGAKPASWMHQLSHVDPAIAPFLDGEKLREAIRATR